MEKYYADEQFMLKIKSYLDWGEIKNKPGLIDYMVDKIHAVLITGLDNENSTARVTAAKLLGRFGRKDDAVIQALLQCDINISDKYSGRGGRDNNVYQAVSIALNGLRTPASVLKEIQWHLSKLPDRRRWHRRRQPAKIRAEAAKSLSQFAQNEQPEVQALIPKIVTALMVAFKDNDSFVRIAAIESLSAFKQDNEKIIQLLFDCDDAEKDLGWRVGAIYQPVSTALAALRMQTSVFKEVQWHLSKLIDHQQPTKIRAEAAKSLSQFAQNEQPEVQVLIPKIITALMVALKDKDYSVGIAAAESLIRLKQATDEIVQVLLDYLDISFFSSYNDYYFPGLEPNKIIELLEILIEQSRSAQTCTPLFFSLQKVLPRKDHKISKIKEKNRVPAVHLNPNEASTSTAASAQELPDTNESVDAIQLTIMQNRLDTLKQRKNAGRLDEKGQQEYKQLKEAFKKLYEKIHNHSTFAATQPVKPTLSRESGSSNKLMKLIKDSLGNMRGYCFQIERRSPNTLVITFQGSKEKACREGKQLAALQKALEAALKEKSVEYTATVSGTDEEILTATTADKAIIDAIVDLLCRQGLNLGPSVVRQHAVLFGQPAESPSSSQMDEESAQISCPVQ